MTRAQELISKIENATIEEILDGSQERWSEELAEYEDGKKYFNTNREQQSKALEDHRENVRKSLECYPEA